jgi:hypothetical protein
MWIYVLSLLRGRFYVGSSRQPTQRIAQHVEGRGTRWTREWPVVRAVEVYHPRLLFSEDNKTKELMYFYGIDKVRGGSYYSLQLARDQLLILEREFDTATGRCFDCGYPLTPNHKCFGPVRARCYYCHEWGHRVGACPHYHKK